MAVTTLAGASRAELGLRALKIGAHRARRLLSWAAFPERWRLPVREPDPEVHPILLYERSVPVRRTDGAAHPVLEEGKRRNLALAAPAFDGLVLTPERPLSFWRALGRPSEARGFRPGIELRGGCIVPTPGGGLCLLSNAIFRLAAELGWRILERYGHTLEAVPSADLLDATVAWPHVDLRVAPRSGAVRLGVAVEGDRLRVSARAAELPRCRVALLEVALDRVATEGGERVRRRAVRRIVVDRAGRQLEDRLITIDRRRVLAPVEAARNCLTCNQSGCHARPAGLAQLGGVT